MSRVKSGIFIIAPIGGDIGERIDCHVEVLASGRRTSQVRVVGATQALGGAGLLRVVADELEEFREDAVGLAAPDQAVVAAFERIDIDLLPGTPSMYAELSKLPTAKRSISWRRWPSRYRPS